MFEQAEGFREHVHQILEVAVESADPAIAVTGHLHFDGRCVTAGTYRYDLQEGRLFLISVGKAALDMGQAALDVLGGRVTEGIIITKQTHSGRRRRYLADVGDGHGSVTVYEGSHPVSDESSVRATEAALKLLKQTTPGDLVLCLISGGTSALLTKPILTLTRWQELIEALLESGCTINELNCVRKQLDEVKGGGLAMAAAPATTVSLILSDVVGNPLDVIGSGPTAPDPESPAEALSVLHRYNIMAELAPETWARITERLTDPRSATSLTRFQELGVKNLVVGDVRTAAEAAVGASQSLGYRSRLLTAYLEGEAREVGRVVAALAKELSPGTCLILGGETTVTVRGSGRGGRNQELALAAALSLAGNKYEDRIVATFATDGEDGPTDAAGAVITGHTVPCARAVGLRPRDWLDRNDTYTFFRKLAQDTEEDCLLRPGPTGTNVNDLSLIFRYPPA